MKIVLTKGLPGSGKTTWAKEQVNKYPDKYKRVNKDDLRAMLDNAHWSKKNEKFILQSRDQIIINSLRNGYDVIVDDTNLHDKHFLRMNEIASQDEFNGKVSVEIKDFTNVPLEKCIEQDLKRLNSVGKDTIVKMYRQFILNKSEPIKSDKNLDKAIICDLDGTLALFEHHRSPYDTIKCFDDLVNEPIQTIIHALNKTHKIIFVSGREDKFKQQTIDWLDQVANMSGLTYELFMRISDDKRKDYIVKKEIYYENINGKYDVTFVLDDRDQVVEMWRSIGLTCLQVNYGDF